MPICRSRDEFMPNDAKLGLLAGVIGVIAVAVFSANRPVPATVASPAASATAAPVAPPPPSVATRTEPATTPIPRTRKEPDGTPAGRKPQDDIER
jgi:hypothetical protein